MKRIIIVMCAGACLLFTGCATPREKLINKCALYENNGTIPAPVNIADGCLGALGGGMVGFFSGSIIGALISLMGPEWNTAAAVTGGSIAVICPVLGFVLAEPGNTLKKGEYDDAKIKKECDDLKISEDRRQEALKLKGKLPAEYDIFNFLWAGAGASAFSSAGYVIGSLIGFAFYNPDGSNNILLAPGGYIGGAIGGLLGTIGGAIYGFSIPERFMSDDEVVEKVLSGRYDAYFRETPVPTPEIFMQK